MDADGPAGLFGVNFPENLPDAPPLFPGGAGPFAAFAAREGFGLQVERCGGIGLVGRCGLQRVGKVCGKRVCRSRAVCRSRGGGAQQRLDEEQKHRRRQEIFYPYAVQNSKNFRTFADKSAKTPAPGAYSAPCGVQGATKIGKNLQIACT